MKKVVLIAGVLFAFIMCLSPVKAADSVAIAQAIDDGLGYLAGVQNPDGSWGTSYEVGTTGLCVKKFEHFALHSNPSINPLDPAYQYYPQVKNGLDYLFSKACVVPIAVQPAGDPDSDGDGVGVYFNYSPCGAEDHYSVYETGMALMAIVENNAKDSVVDVPGSPVDGWTYYDVAVDCMDWLAFAQNDGGNERGGWGYTSNLVGWSDNSISGYAVLGISYASSAAPEGFGIPIPPFVLTELSMWIAYIQCNVVGPNDGGSGYESTCNGVNTLKTGNLLFQMELVGQDVGADVNADRAVTYLINHWYDANNDPGWQNHCQAMYCIMKGLEFQGVGQFLDPPANTIDWYDEFTDHIVAIQNPDGSWPNDPWGGKELSTAWALLTLEKAAPPSIGIPTLTEWGMIIFCVLLFGWMAWVIVRRRRKVTAGM